jgi:tetratricopeptide (TPR) repeat protein
LVRQAAALEPDNGEILFQAGLAYELLNRRAEALEWIGKALRHGHPRKFVESEPALTALRADKNYLAMVASLR